jgi:hypothetical protein
MMISAISWQEILDGTIELVLETNQAKAVFIKSVGRCARGNVAVDLSAFRGQGCAAGCGVRGVLREARRGDATFGVQDRLHMKGARRASICSWVSGDIGVAAVFLGRPHMCADRNWR